MSSDAWQPKIAGGPGGLLGPRFARVIETESEVEVTPVVWRRVGAAVTPASGGKADAASPDLTAQIQRMEQQCEQRVKEARAAGLREGEAAARTRAAAEVQPVIEKLARSIEDLAQIRGRLRKQVEGDTIKLSLAIARRVLRRELAIDHDAMRGLVMAALEKLQAQEICRVRTNPAQAAAVTACLREGASNAKVEVIPDGSLQPGGVVFETNHGNLDASVDSQLAEIERGLADHLKRQS
ncbi:MAG: FliH/SctL family protein [Bryobacteraceae bacterium]|jgi:flagellar assembly protein FliH